ncbi:hypothetical protein GGR58DRAFT_340641 [Xylaria digitata]|nr:hypothetical protein GGR58DRAFT_340641 [Xylaria digitata]
MAINRSVKDRITDAQVLSLRTVNHCRLAMPEYNLLPVLMKETASNMTEYFKPFLCLYCMCLSLQVVGAFIDQSVSLLRQDLGSLSPSRGFVVQLNICINSCLTSDAESSIVIPVGSIASALGLCWVRLVIPKPPKVREIHDTYPSKFLGCATSLSERSINEASWCGTVRCISTLPI